MTDQASIDVQDRAAVEEVLRTLQPYGTMRPVRYRDVLAASGPGRHVVENCEPEPEVRIVVEDGRVTSATRLRPLTRRPYVVPWTGCVPVTLDHVDALTDALRAAQPDVDALGLMDLFDETCREDMSRAVVVYPLWTRAGAPSVVAVLDRAGNTHRLRWVGQVTDDRPWAVLVEAGA